jgi:uncharacterized protein DUF1905
MTGRQFGQQMRTKKFKAELLTGHKESAVEVPFNPVEEWQIEPGRLWRGRRGFAVVAKINDISCETSIVPRQKKFYLLVDRESQRAAGISEGDLVTVTVKLEIPNDGGRK